MPGFHIPISCDEEILAGLRADQGNAREVQLF
jgi:hypothetical protein